MSQFGAIFSEVTLLGPFSTTQLTWQKLANADPAGLGAINKSAIHTCSKQILFETYCRMSEPRGLKRILAYKSLHFLHLWSIGQKGLLSGFETIVY